MSPSSSSSSSRERAKGQDVHQSRYSYQEEHLHSQNDDVKREIREGGGGGFVPIDDVDDELDLNRDLTTEQTVVGRLKDNGDGDGDIINRLNRNEERRINIS